MQQHQHTFIDRKPPETVLSCLSNDEVVDWGITAVGAPYAWRYTRGQGVTVAVLDTGVARHPDLDRNIIDRLSVRPEWNPLDHVGHGTHCAGIVAAVDNGTGVVGIAPDARVVSIKVLGDNGQGGYDDLARGIDMAVDYGVDIISMSLGCMAAPEGPALYQAIERAHSKGIVIAAAAGNEYNPKVADTINYPARFALTIPVAAIDPKSAHAPFSSEGKELRRGVSMPGVQIYSTYLDGTYATLSGTSMATPMLAGFVALMIAYHEQGQHRTPLAPRGKSQRAVSIWEHLRRYARSLGDSSAFGIGVVDGRKLGQDGD